MIQVSEPVNGYHEVDGQLAAYVGLTPADAGDVRDDYSKAVAQRCQPPPQVDFEEYPDPTNSAKRVVAINVWPSLNLIGVKIEAHKPTEGYGGASYVYPIRSGTDATYLQPVQLPMYMTPQIRRIVVMLSRIPSRSKVQLIEARLDGAKIDNAFLFDGIAEEENLAKFLTFWAEPSQLHVPLDRILTVYQGQDSNWRVVSQFFR